MKFDELPEKTQEKLLKTARKSLVIRTVILAAFFLAIAALIASVGYNMWVIAIFPALVAVIGIINLFMELKSPDDTLYKRIKSADYPSSFSASESD